MDGQIRLRPAGAPTPQPSPARKTITLRGTPTAGIASLRKAILDCAHQATTAEPVDTDRRLHSFIAKLSGTMEHLGERELDAALWNLMSTDSGEAPAPDDQLGMDWWNSLSEERRAHWLRVAGSARPVDAWRAFRDAEDDLAKDG